MATVFLFFARWYINGALKLPSQNLKDSSIRGSYHLVYPTSGIIPVTALIYRRILTPAIM